MCKRRLVKTARSAEKLQGVREGHVVIERSVLGKISQRPRRLVSLGLQVTAGYPRLPFTGSQKTLRIFMVVVLRRRSGRERPRSVLWNLNVNVR